jgi:hypothetical protein
MVKILLSEQSLPPKSARDGKAIILRVNANYHHNSKHYRCFGNVQPQCSLHEFGNDVRSCHNFSPIDLVCFGLAAQCCFGTMDVRSNPAKQHKNDNDDQDGADDTDTTVSITVTVAAEPANVGGRYDRLGVNAGRGRSESGPSTRRERAIGRAGTAGAQLQSASDKTGDK